MSMQTEGEARGRSVLEGLDDVSRVRDEQDLDRAVEAYRFFYPTVSMEAFFQGIRDLGVEDGRGLLALFVGPRHVGLTMNGDTPYALGVLDLGESGPVVIEVPPGPFVGLVDDHHQRWVHDVGLPGLDGGHGGRHLLLPPGYDRDVPDGYLVHRSTTRRVAALLRTVPVEGDVDAAMAALRTVKVYALGRPGDVLPFVDVTDRPLDLTPVRWEEGLEFWSRLHAAIADEPVPLEFRPMYGALAALGIEKGAPFAPDERMRRILVTGARRALAQMRVEAFASDRPDRVVWPDRRWEWIGLVPNDADFETDGFLDVEARDRWFYQTGATSPAIFRRQVGVGSVYFVAFRDRDGAWLDGARSYRLRVPAPVPASLFWSVTAYDLRTRSQLRTPQDRAVLGSLKDDVRPDADGGVDLFFGPEPPRGAEGRWIQTDPTRGFFLYFRVYGPQAAAFDGAWRPDDLTAAGRVTPSA